MKGRIQWVLKQDASNTASDNARRVIDDFAMQEIHDAFVGNNAELIELDFHHSNLNDVRLLHLLSALKHNTACLKLDLSNTEISDIGLTGIIFLLENHNHTIIEIDVSDITHLYPVKCNRLQDLLEVNKLHQSMQRERLTMNSLIDPNLLEMQDNKLFNYTIP